MSVFRCVLTKQGSWRGVPEQWSNGYCFSGTEPADRAAAIEFFNAVFALEGNFHRGQQLVKGYYYPDTNDGTVVKWGNDYLTDGSAAQVSPGGLLNSGPTNKLSLEQAALMRARCGETSKGKPRYVMKYFHGVFAKQTNPDLLDTLNVSVVTPELEKWTNGTLPGGAKLCRPDGLVCATPQLRPFITTRTLKRRGKRPSS